MTQALRTFDLIRDLAATLCSLIEPWVRRIVRESVAEATPSANLVAALRRQVEDLAVELGDACGDLIPPTSERMIEAIRKLNRDSVALKDLRKQRDEARGRLDSIEPEVDSITARAQKLASTQDRAELYLAAGRSAKHRFVEALGLDENASLDDAISEIQRLKAIAAGGEA